MRSTSIPGGEFLSALAPFSGHIVATEGYEPNVSLAQARLAPFGIALVQVASAPDNMDQTDPSLSHLRSPLPFASGTFELVIDRHSSYWPSEVHRVLREGGRFLTQQRSEAGTTGSSWEELFARPPHVHRFTLSFAADQLANFGFEIIRADEVDTPMTFLDLAAVVYYLRLVPWVVDGFDPIEDRRAIDAIQERLRADGRLLVCGSHMLIDARVGS